VFFIFPGIFLEGGGVLKDEKDKGDLGSISEKEHKLLKIVRNLEYGELLITVKNREPVHLEEIKKSIKL